LVSDICFGEDGGEGLLKLRALGNSLDDGAPESRHGQQNARVVAEEGRRQSHRCLGERVDESHESIPLFLGIGAAVLLQNILKWLGANGGSEGAVGCQGDAPRIVGQPIDLLIYCLKNMQQRVRAGLGG